MKYFFQVENSKYQNNNFTNYIDFSFHLPTFNLVHEGNYHLDCFQSFETIEKYIQAEMQTTFS